MNGKKRALIDPVPRTHKKLSMTFFFQPFSLLVPVYQGGNPFHFFFFFFGRTLHHLGQGCIYFKNWKWIGEGEGEGGICVIQYSRVQDVEVAWTFLHLHSVVGIEKRPRGERPNKSKCSSYRYSDTDTGPDTDTGIIRERMQASLGSVSPPGARDRMPLQNVPIEGEATPKWTHMWHMAGIHCTPRSALFINRTEGLASSPFRHTSCLEYHYYYYYPQESVAPKTL